jgi:N-acetylneuraminate synthase
MAMAKELGAGAIKLQTYTPASMTIDCDRADFVITGGPWNGFKLFELYQWAQTPFEWHEELFAFGRELGLTVFSTPFDESAVDLLERLGAPAYKIASFEAIDLPLIGRVARTGKPVIISTGMASLSEIEEAVQCARDHGCAELALMHCVSSYPTPIEQANLRTLKDLGNHFDVVVGLSDHTLGVAAAIAAVALGASLIEKHVTLSRADKGPDSEFSLEPEDLRRLCVEARAAWLALGSATYDLKEAEKLNIVFRRSIYVVADVAAGETFTRENVRIIRPGHGLPPKVFGDVLGRRAARALKRGDRLSWEDVA